MILKKHEDELYEIWWNINNFTVHSSGHRTGFLIAMNDFWSFDKLPDYAKKFLLARGYDRKLEIKEKV